MMKFRSDRGNWKSVRIVALLLITAAFCGCNRPSGQTNPISFYVGSSDMNLEHSIFLCQMDPATGVFSVLDSFASAKCPYYLDAGPGKKFLYSVDKTPWDSDSGFMAVASFRINGNDHRISFLNRQSSEGDGPCHVAVSKKGAYLFTANYASGTVASFPILEDGSIGKALYVMHGEGSGPVEGRQEGPHAHQVVPDPENRFLLVPDLGADRIRIYAFDPGSGSLQPNPSQPFLQMQAGSGPRHLAFHPSGKLVFVANELNATVSACRYDPEKGVLSPINSESTVTGSHTGSKWPAAVRVASGGDWVYASTRGENSCLTVFRVREDGGVERIQVVDGVANWPRDINITPSGNWLLVAGERGNVLEAYAIDKTTGMLSETGPGISIHSPGCIFFID